MEGKQPGKIKKLDEVVINRIAAGEVIQRPANALKELLENSLDAGARNIQVVTKAGGLKLLQIQDDGTGINREDLEIVCERFTTSKLQKFEDLLSIGTFGFRGEALASISHVAHLSIVTKTSDSVCAYKAEYTDGQLKQFPPESNCQNPKPCAGKQGTLISAEDLFYNMETRRRALKNANDEHNKIVDVVTKYAVHNPEVGFSVKKFGESTTDVRTPPSSTTLENIKILYGSQISREVIGVSCEDEQCRMNGYVSNVNYSTKKLIFLLFINQRLVDSTALRRSLESIYSNYLPKGTHPFLYISIEIHPANVDVNVHPTKHEVHFLHEDAIISAVTNSVENTLLGSNQSRTFYVQSLLPGASESSTSALNTSSIASKRRKTENKNNSNPFGTQISTSVINQNSSISAKNMVRTDPKAQKLDKFFSENFSNQSSKIQQESESSPASSTSVATPSDTISLSSSSGIGVKRREIRLRSIKNMRAKIEEDCHSNLLSVFRNHSFVGSVDRTLALIQHDVNLYMCNTFKLSAELFYQRIVQDFGNFGRIVIEDPITIKELVADAVEAEDDHDKVLAIKKIQDVLLSKSNMLDDYFCLKFDPSGRLLTIPLLLDNYYPSMEGVPNYLVNIATKVNWSQEQTCFETFAHQTALFYAVQPGGDKLNEEISLNGHSWKWTIEHIIYPEFKKSLMPPKTFAADSTVMMISHLPDLYKVFERC